MRKFPKPEDSVKERFPIFLVFAVLLFFAVISAAYLFSDQQFKKSEIEAEQKISAVGSLKQAQISQWLMERWGDCQVIKDNPGTVVRFYNFSRHPDSVSGNQLMQWMRLRLNSYRYENIFFLNSSKQLLLKVGGNEEPDFQSEFYSLLNKANNSHNIIFSDFYQTDRNGNKDVDFIIPLFENQKIVGYIVLRCDPKLYIRRILSNKLFYQNTALNFIVENKSGMVRYINPLDNNPESLPLKDTSLYLKKDTVINQSADKGNPVIASINKISGSPWYLVTQVDKDEIYAPVREQELMIMIIAGLFVVGTTTGAGLLWRNRQAKIYKRLYQEEKEKKELSEKLDFFIKQANDIIIMSDSEGKILEVNDKAKQFYQYSSEEYSGMDSNLLRASGFKKNSLKDFYDDIYTSGGKVYETVHITKDGTAIPVEASTSVIEKNGKTYLQSIIRDISDRKKAEFQQDRLNRLYEITGAVNKVIIRCSDMENLVNEICRITAEKGQFKMCWIGKLEGDTIVPIAYAGDEDGYFKEIILRSDKSQFSEGPISRSIKSKGIAFSNDVLNDPFMFPWKDQVKGRFNSIASVPLFNGTKVSGVFVVYSAEKDFFNTSELQLLEGVGYDIAYAIGKVKNNLEKEKIDKELKKANAKFRGLIENNSDIIALLDANGIILYESPSIKKVLGYDSAERIGKRVFNILPIDEQDNITRMLSELVKKSENHIRSTFRAKHQNGKWKWLEVDGLNLLEDESIGAIVLNFRDITEKIETLQRLRESEILYRQLASNFPNGDVFLFDEELKFLVVEGSFIGKSGQANIEGKTLNEIYPPEISNQLEPYYRDTLAGKFTVSEISDRGRTFLIRTVPIQSEDGKIVMGMVVSQDITEQKRAADEIKKLNTNLESKIKERTAELENTNRELEAFAYSVSHDLRAPLRSINGFSQALLEDYKDKLDETGSNYLSRVRNASQRMGNLIDDLLSLSKITRKEFEKTNFNMSELADSISRELFDSNPERNVKFLIKPGLFVKGDKVLIQAAVTNLLENAFKFTSKVEEAKIEFGSQTIDDETVFFVQDNGIGFNPVYASKLFAPFQRLHSQEEYPGTGIGLANVQRVIGRHGGRIWVDSEINKGTTFYFTLNGN